LAAASGLAAGNSTSPQAKISPAVVSFLQIRLWKTISAKSSSCAYWVPRNRFCACAQNTAVVFAERHRLVTIFIVTSS
jgi:hypothetical protein